MPGIRIGFGYDVHPLQAARELVLGGVSIPSEKGALGHSDADVLIHAMMDALLGALALGDIGRHFPDHDPAWKGADSKDLLRHVMDMVHSQGYILGNLDATLCLEQPKIAGFIPGMKEALCPILQVDAQAVSIKATTGEKLGFVGRQEGVSAYAVVLLRKGQV